MGKAAGAIIGAVLVVVGTFVPGAQGLIPYGYSLIVSNALGIISQALIGKPNSTRLGQDVEYDGTVEPRRLIYGLQKVSGMNVIPPWTSGPKNKLLHQVLALAGHECNRILNVFFGIDEIDDGDIHAVTGTQADGRVESGTYNLRAWVRRYRGTLTQTVDYILNQAFPVDWDNSHRGLGVAYLALQYEIDEEVYRTGRPQVTCMVEGMACYDPRLDSAPGANPTTAAYIAYTTNPALCLAHYLTSAALGLGESNSRVDWDLVLAAANICDELVTLPGSQTQKRYTCNVTLYVAVTDEDRRSNIQILVGAMMGHAVFRTGQWRIYAGAASAPSFALTADDLVGRFTISTETSTNEKYNYVPGQFVDKDRNYQLVEFEPQSNAAYEATDGDRFPREALFVACDNQYEAQRDAMIVLKRSRRKKKITGSWAMSAFKIRPWDTGTITLDEMQWANQKVRCTAWQFNQDGTIEATFLDEVDSDWDDPLPADYTGFAVGGGPPPGPYVPDEPLDFIAQPSVDGIRFAFTYPANVQTGTRAYIYEATAGAAFSTAVRVSPNFLGNTYFLNKADQTARDYWITMQWLPTGLESDPVGPVRAAALAISATFHVNLSSNTVYKKLTGVASGNSGSVTATGVNGTLPYTSTAWTRVSGATTITANTPSSPTTSFHNSGMTNGENNVAVFRCTFTATGGATAYNEVTVTFYRDDGL